MSCSTARRKSASRRALDEIGIYEIEAGTVASSEEVSPGDRRDLRGMGLKAKISVLCRGLEDDIDNAARLGVWGFD